MSTGFTPDPKTQKEIFKRAFPHRYENEVDEPFLRSNQEFQCSPIREDFSKVKVGQETLEIPSRIYCDENHFRKVLTDVAGIQKTILACFGTRNSDGLVRERYLKDIISMNHDFVVPYVLHLVGGSGVGVR